MSERFGNLANAQVQAREQITLALSQKVGKKSLVCSKKSQLGYMMLALACRHGVSLSCFISFDYSFLSKRILLSTLNQTETPFLDLLQIKFIKWFSFGKLFIMIFQSFLILIQNIEINSPQTANPWRGKQKTICKWTDPIIYNQWS